MSNQNELLETLKGFLLLLLFHLCAGVIIFLLGWLSSPIGNYTILFVWIIGAIGFFFWQLLYVIPLIIWLKRRRKMGMMKGVIIGAVLTAVAVAILGFVCSLERKCERLRGCVFLPIEVVFLAQLNQ